MVISKEVLQKRGSYWEGRIKVFLEETVPENPVVFIGDSLTERFPLRKYFGDRFINRGIGGDHADGLWERRDLLALEKNPRALFFMAGINDLLFDYKRDEIPYHLEKIVSYAKKEAPRAKIYIQSICPIKDWQRPTPGEIKEINGELMELSARFRATYIDLYKLFADDKGLILDEFTIDGVHLSEKAYDLWQQEVRRHLII